MERAGSIGNEKLLDCIVIGAGPGGLQACIHLGRYNFRVMLFHSPGGRTYLAKHIENYLGLREVSGSDLLEAGIAQAKSFGVSVENAKVQRVLARQGHFVVQANGKTYLTRFVIAASGAQGDPRSLQKPSALLRQLLLYLHDLRRISHNGQKAACP